jgi:hypothetical protein
VPQSICDQAGFAFIMSQTILTQLDCNLNLLLPTPHGEQGTRGKSLLTEWINNYTCIFRKWDISKLRISNLLCRIAIFLCAIDISSNDLWRYFPHLWSLIFVTYMYRQLHGLCELRCLAFLHLNMTLRIKILLFCIKDYLSAILKYPISIRFSWYW